MKTIILLSGGMDSTVALWDALEKGHDVVACLGVDYASKHNGKELPMARWQAEQAKVPFQIADLTFMNQLFQSDHAIYPDCREDFLAPMSQAISAGTYADVEVLRPFVDLRKEDIAARGAELGVDFTHTWSCYKGLDTHCGKCGTCVERKEAFALANLVDPTQYEIA